MAKAVKIHPDIAEAHPQQWFAEAMRVRFEEVLKFVDAARDPDEIEGVHDIRVAIRRLRSLIRDFAGVAGNKTVAKFSAGLKEVAGRLSVVRDLDVLIEAIKKASSDAPEEAAAGISELIGHYRGRRLRALQSASAYLDDDAIDDLKKQLEAACRAAVRQPGLFDSPDVRREARITITENLDEFRSKSGALLRPTAAKKLHKLRIAAKRLRYSLELHSPHFEGRLDDAASEVKQMQGHLGDLHDCDVWIDELRTHLERKPAKGTAERRAAAAWLLSQFARQRNKAYLSAFELWTKWESEDLINGISRILKDFSK
ncbi:MAG: CHAD domain-containing protein [Chloracidobacterium sp.]|nr:CHAD domain-containing protein [Chloracidobacterium sp.]